MTEPTTNMQSYESFNQKEDNEKLDNDFQTIVGDNGVIKAEEEVVAVILSAILGSIIESWEFLPHQNNQSKTYGDSVVCSDENSIRKKDTAVETLPTQLSYDVHSEVSASLSDKKHSLSENSFKELMNLYTSGERRNKLSKKNKKWRSDDSSLQLPSITEEVENPIQLILKTLILNEKDNIFGWEFLETNLDVIIKFKQGNRYEGRLSNCRMHGLGKFFWADGSMYKGEFYKGQITGEGYLQWPNQSWYEGQLLQGYRNGLGLFVQGKLFYAGNWKCGMRHGLGSMFYNNWNTNIDFYNGEWYRDFKDGTGLQSYPSGAMYSGQWEKGLRHGLGTMVWTNCDVYSGNWERGKIHGYGEYTWDTFFNTQLVVPLENCYYGNWENNVRHGNGTLETSQGVVVRGTWKNGKKHGPAELIYRNGNFVYASNLFHEDCISIISDNSIDTNSLEDTSMSTSVDSFQLHKLPVNAANHDINLTFYIDRLSNFIVYCKRTGKHFGRTSRNSTLRNQSNKFRSSNTFEENMLGYESEELLLRNIVLQYLSALKLIYTKYAQLCCETKPKFPSVLMRLMLWQLIRDCNLHNRGFSLADFDILIANNRASLVQGVHYPFERLQFWQFLHCLIELSWELYGKHCDGSPTVYGILASALHKLITWDIFSHTGKHNGNALFKYKNILSLDAMYWFYRGIGEPHTARKFLKNVFAPSEENDSQQTIPNFSEYLLHGTNMIGVGGRLIYYPEEAPLLLDSKHSFDTNHPQNLTCFKHSGLLAVLNCLLEICPSIASNGLIVNMDYKIVFLEFYEILLMCAKLNVKKSNINTDEIVRETLENEAENKLDGIAEEFQVEENNAPSENNKTKKPPKGKKK